MPRYACDGHRASPVRLARRRPASAAPSCGWLVLAIGGLAYALIHTVPDRTLVSLLLTAYGLIDQLAPPVYAALFWRRATTAGVFAGLGAGALVTVFFIFYPELRPLEIHEGVLGVIVNTIVLVLVSRMTARRAPERAEEFVAA